MKDRAILLRKSGKSLDEICRILGCKKTTVFHWIRGVKLSKTSRRSIREAGWLKMTGSKNPNWKGGPRRHLLSREELSKKISEEFLGRKRVAFEEGFNRARVDPEFRAICLLYWAEGCKCGAPGNHLILSNSEPELLNIFLLWLTSQGLNGRVRLGIQVHKGNGISDEEINSYWRQLEVTKEIRVYRINNSRCSKRIRKTLKYGTCQLLICDLRLKYMVFGGIEYLKSLSSFYKPRC